MRRSLFSLHPGGHRHAARRRRGEVLEERTAAGHRQHQGVRGPEGRRQGQSVMMMINGDLARGETLSLRLVAVFSGREVTLKSYQLKLVENAGGKGCA